MNSEILNKCVLFSGLSGADAEYAYRFFHAEFKAFPKGSYLNNIGDTLNFFGLVINGTIQVYMDDINGSHMIMANVTEGETFGESLCFLGEDTSVYICAMTNADVLCMNTDSIKNASTFADPRDKMLSNRFTAMLAKRTLAMNDRIQILSKISLREKLVTFLSEYSAKAGSQTIELPFNREDMAVYLGTDRSSLSRELSQMKKDGIIDYTKNRFTINRHL